MSDATPAREGDRPAVSDYDDMAAEVEATIAWIDDKLENGRIRDVQRAKARQGYLRLKIQAIGEWRKLKESADLDELAKQVDELRERQERKRVTV